MCCGTTTEDDEPTKRVTFNKEYFRSFIRSIQSHAVAYMSHFYSAYKVVSSPSLKTPVNKAASRTGGWPPHSDVSKKVRVEPTPAIACWRR